MMVRTSGPCKCKGAKKPYLTVSPSKLSSCRSRCRGNGKGISYMQNEECTTRESMLRASQLESLFFQAKPQECHSLVPSVLTQFGHVRSLVFKESTFSLHVTLNLAQEEPKQQFKRPSNGNACFANKTI